MPTEATGVLRLAGTDRGAVRELLARFGLELVRCEDDVPIPGSYWGDDEAGLSDDAEETAVCYLQALLADALPGVGRERIFADMDAWGYSFRLGSAQAWFERDAEDARAWLSDRGVIDPERPETLRPRGSWTRIRFQGNYDD